MRFRISWRSVPAEIIFLFLLDGLILSTSMYYGVALRYVIGDPYEYGEVLPLYPRAIAFTLLMLATLGMMGMYKRSILHANPVQLPRLAVSVLIGAVLMVVAGFLLPGLFLGRGSIMISAVLALLTIVTARHVLRRFLSSDTSK